MDILRQSLQKQNLNIMQTTCSTIYSTTSSTIPSDSPECQKVQTPAWVAQNKTTGEKFNSTTKQTELQDIVSKEMIRKFEKINKAFNSYKPLLSKVLTKARENSATKTYSSYFEKWKIWATQFPEFNVLPANKFHIVLYMIHLLQTGKTFPVIRMSYFATNCFHSIVGYQNPCPTSLPYNAVEGIKRILAYSTTKKSPVTVSQLCEMYNYFETKTILICVLSFMGFLRFSEVIKLSRCDITKNKAFLSIFIEKSKTGVYREGSWVYLTKLDTVLCPIELVSQNFKKGNIRGNCQKYNFRGIITTKSHSKLRSCDKHISYTCVRENVIEGLKNIGVDTKLFGLHSLRAAGATAAANLGVNDRPF